MTVETPIAEPPELAEYEEDTWAIADYDPVFEKQREAANLSQPASRIGRILFTLGSIVLVGGIIAYSHSKDNYDIKDEGHIKAPDNPAIVDKMNQKDIEPKLKKTARRI